ncbi:MAG: hypothetical protein Q7R96_06435, partial [Nanoarchaeota archaeon]|nr:hypothetical protein [Nanoarchaeota archaeon]
ARKGFGKGGAVVALSEVNRKVVGRYSYPSNDFSGLQYVLLGDKVGSISHRATVLPWATAELHPTLPVVCVSSLEYIYPKELHKHPAIDKDMIIDCDTKGKHPVSATGWRGNALRFYVLGYDFPLSLSDRLRNLC